MHLNADQIDALKRIEQSTKRYQAAEQARWRAIRAADDAGVPRLRIAHAAGIDKMTMWRRLEGE